MAGKGIDIVHQLHRAGPGRRAASTSRERDDRGGRARVLVGTDLEEVRRDDPVKAGPVEAIVGVVQFTDDAVAISATWSVSPSVRLAMIRPVSV